MSARSDNLSDPPNRRERRAMERVGRSSDPSRLDPPRLNPPPQGTRSGERGDDPLTILFSLARRLLNRFAHERGLLFLGEGRVPVVRALALAQAHLLSFSRDFSVGPWAGELADARRRLLQLENLFRETPRCDFIEIVELLRAWHFEQHGEAADPGAQLGLYPWGRLLHLALSADEEKLRLRAARFLLNRTLPDARKVGRKDERLSEEEKELLEEIRARKNSLGLSQPPPPPPPPVLGEGTRSGEGAGKKAETPTRAPP